MPTDAQAEPVSPKPNRRWFQFRLRTVLGLVTLLGIWLGLWVNSAERQRRAVEFVESLGGWTSYDDSRDDPFGYPTEVERSWYRELLGDDFLSTVIKVNLRGTHVTDSDLEQLKGLAATQLISLDDTQISDAGLMHLKALTSLRVLTLARTRVGDTGLEHLKGLTALESLSLDDTQVTDAGIEYLKGLASLRLLALDNTPTTGSGIAELQATLPECMIWGPNLQLVPSDSPADRP